MVDITTADAFPVIWVYFHKIHEWSILCVPFQKVAACSNDLLRVLGVGSAIHRNLKESLIESSSPSTSLQIGDQVGKGKGMSPGPRGLAFHSLLIGEAHLVLLDTYST